MGTVKTQRIDLRTSEEVKRLLQEAAQSCHKSVSEFLLEAGISAAQQTLFDRRYFVLEEEQWRAFCDIMNRPVQSKPNLKRLLSEPGVLD